MLKQERRSILTDRYMVDSSFGVIDENELATTAAEFGITQATLKKELKELGCLTYKRKPPKVLAVDVYLPIIENFSLHFGERMPKYLQRRSVREIVGPKWKRVRETALAQNEHVCSLCGYQPEELQVLHLHEVWGKDKESRILYLEGLQLICTYCHDIKHIKLTSQRARKAGLWNEYQHKLNIHFMKTNRCTQVDMIAYKRLRHESSKTVAMLKLPFEEMLIQYNKQIELVDRRWTYDIY